MQPLRATDPRHIGPYTTTHRLGAGGMGEVYLAESRTGLRLAVKVVRAEHAEDRTFRARFRHEVRAAQTVGGADTYTARVVDADTEAERPWMATEFVSGPNLRDAVLDHGALPRPSVRILAAALGEALAAIHAKGLVHRDLKPSNILLGPDGPRVIDFGIVRALEATSLTRTGAVVGSVGYVSPEQIRNGGQVGPPSDVFSLGAVLAYAAAGREPFGEGQDSVVLLRILTRDFDLSGVPEDIRPLVTACLREDPLERPAPAAVVAGAGYAPDTLRAAVRPGWYGPASPPRPTPDDRPSGVEYLTPHPTTALAAPATPAGSAASATPAGPGAPATTADPAVATPAGPAAEAANDPATRPTPAAPALAATSGASGGPAVASPSGESVAPAVPEGSAAAAADAPVAPVPTATPGTSDGPAPASPSGDSTAPADSAAAAAGDPAARVPAATSGASGGPAPASPSGDSTASATPADSATRATPTGSAALAAADDPGTRTTPVAPVPAATLGTPGGPAVATPGDPADSATRATPTGSAAVVAPGDSAERAAPAGSAGLEASAGPDARGDSVRAAGSDTVATPGRPGAVAPGRRRLLTLLAGGAVAVAGVGAGGRLWGFGPGTGSGGGSDRSPAPSADRTDGAAAVLRWQYDLGGIGGLDGACCALSPDGSVVYAGTSGGVLHAVSRDGARRWKVRLGDDVSTPVATRDAVYCVVGLHSEDERRLTAVSPSGSPLWTRTLGGRRYDVPVLLGQDVLVSVGGTDTGGLRCYASDGSEKWTAKTPAGPTGIPLVSAGTVCTGSYGDVLLALDARNGSRKWQVSAGTDVTVLALAGTTLFTDSAAERQGFRVSDGRRLWRREDDGGILTGGSRTLAVGTEQDGVYAVRAADGSRAWRYGLGGGTAYPRAVVAGDTVYARAGERVCALGLDGKERWNAVLGRDAGDDQHTPVARGGRLYVPSGSGIAAVDVSR
ncbi:PQQ-binding-like beta-propeller repeat protein [Streptomyces sp. NPDC047841]|uniref:protein kinase domain-containing protein n=1 Tax=Streptomyces sp. NPDC047841 TaxID=3154708 RepID=UPI0034539F42